LKTSPPINLNKNKERMKGKRGSMVAGGESWGGERDRAVTLHNMGVVKGSTVKMIECLFIC